MSDSSYFWQATVRKKGLGNLLQLVRHENGGRCAVMSTIRRDDVQCNARNPRCALETLGLVYDLLSVRLPRRG